MLVEDGTKARKELNFLTEKSYVLLILFVRNYVVFKEVFESSVKGN